LRKTLVLAVAPAQTATCPAVAPKLRQNRFKDSATLTPRFIEGSSRDPGKSLTRDQILETHARYEAHQEAKTPTMPYFELLGVVHSMVAREWGVETTADEDIKFGSSVPDWPAFADSADALRYLKAHYKLVILSNVDRESFKGSHARLQVEFDHIFTAQDIGSYKPDQRNFDYMIAKLAAEGIRKKEILHTAESLFHDHLPANKAGLASAWIYRRHGQQGFGATQPSGAMPRYDFQFTSIGRNDAGAPGGFARQRLMRISRPTH
jgi:2-haloacid dehalogenase